MERQLEFHDQNQSYDEEYGMDPFHNSLDEKFKGYIPDLQDE